MPVKPLTTSDAGLSQEEKDGAGKKVQRQLE